MVPTPPAQRCWALTCELNKTAWPFKKGRGRLWEGQRVGKKMSKNNAGGSPACSSLKVPAVVALFCPSSPLPFPCWCYLPHTHTYVHACQGKRRLPSRTFKPCLSLDMQYKSRQLFPSPPLQAACWLLPYRGQCHASGHSW